MKNSIKYIVRCRGGAVTRGATRDCAHQVAERLNKRYGGGYEVWNRYTKAVSRP